MTTSGQIPSAELLLTGNSTTPKYPEGSQTSVDGDQLKSLLSGAAAGAATVGGGPRAPRDFPAPGEQSVDNATTTTPPDDEPAASTGDDEENAHEDAGEPEPQPDEIPSPHGAAPLDEAPAHEDMQAHARLH